MCRIETEDHFGQLSSGNCWVNEQKQMIVCIDIIFVSRSGKRDDSDDN